MRRLHVGRGRVRGPGELVSAPSASHCRCCGNRFSDGNVFSEAGWIETRISGICEVCYDAGADLFLMEGNHDGRTEENEAGD